MNRRAFNHMRQFFSSSLLVLALLSLSAIDTPAHAENAATTVAAGGTSIVREDMPAWVTLRVLPEATPARMDHSNEGIAYLLTDLQARVRSDGYDQWFRTASKVVERSGLEAAGQLTVDFDPHFQTVSIDFIHVIRAGKIIDLTPETSFRIVEHEDNLDDGIISGSLKAIANLRDVRVGDIVDFAYTTHNASTLWPSQFFDHFSQRFSDPLAMYAVRYLWPAGMNPQMKALNSTVTFTSRKLEDQTEWEWIAQDPLAQKGEDDVPATAYQWGAVDISTMHSWNELAKWGANLYAGDDSLPDDFRARLDTIAKDHPTADDRLTEVFRYLQDSIRYVGEEMGEGSYVPRRPNVVLNRGYGDCKDKSLLLAVALHHLGIEAIPALVATQRGETLPNRLPSPLLFDHVIVRAVLNGKVLWLDPTGTHSGGRGLDIVPADFGYALPLVSGQMGLERMEGYSAHAGKMAVLEQFNVDEKGATPLSLHVETRYTGARADGMRIYVANRSSQTVAQGNLDFYRNRFAGLTESKPIEFRDDRDANALVMTENYTLPRADFDKDKIAAKLITRAYAVSDLLPDRQASPRQQALALPANAEREQVIELQVKDRKLWLLDNIDSKAGDIAFSRQSTQSGDLTRITYHLVTGADTSVPASGAEAIYALSDKIKDETGLEFYLEKSAHLSDIKTSGLDEAVLTPLRADLDKIIALSQKGDDASAIEALSSINAMATKLKAPSPEAGMLDGLKGAILAQLRRPGPALAALRSATGQFDGNPEVYRLWLAFEIDKGDPDAIANALHRTLQVQPAIVASLDQRWVQSIHQHLNKLPSADREKATQDLCITLADSGWQLNPRTSIGGQMLTCAIEAHSRRGDLDKARAGLALNPGGATLAMLAIDKRHEALWPDIDKFAADGFRKSLEQDAERAAAIAKAAPRDAKAVMAYMRALRVLGRNLEAINAGKALAADKAQIETVGDDAFWLVDEYSKDLAAVGRTDEAIGALDGLLALGIDSYPSLISMAINRAGLLNDAARHQEALDAATAVDEKYASHVSAYGQMWVWAEQACALYALSRPAEAKTIESKMAAKPDDNWLAMTRVAACRNDIPAIADIVIRRLKDEEQRSTALGLFLRFRGQETLLPFQRRLREAMTTALETPAVQAEFRQFGRAVNYAGTRAGWSDF